MDPRVVTDVISKSSGNTFLMGFMHPVPGLMPNAASSNDYKPGFMTDLMCKDLGLAVDDQQPARIPPIRRSRSTRRGTSGCRSS